MEVKTNSSSVCRINKNKKPAAAAAAGSDESIYER